MQTSIRLRGQQFPQSGRAIRGAASRVIDKLSTALAAVSDRAWLTMAAISMPAVILFAGRLSATGARADLTGLAISSMAAFLFLCAAVTRQAADTATDPEKGGDK